MKRAGKSTLSEQVKEHSIQEEREVPNKFDGNTETMISTGSTLLDLAISGGRKRGGGLPGGILVEIFGPPSSGKTVLLCEIAGAVQRQGGEVMFHDPEARLNKQFASMFDLDTDIMTYGTPDTIPEVFSPIREWAPSTNGSVHGIFADSLAALTTEAEMGDKDDYGMRRAKEFSQELRKTCRVLKSNNYLMVCSNQVRENVGGGQYEAKWRTPGGQGIPFYASLRLKCSGTQKLKKDRTLENKKIVSRVIGVETEITVVKSSVWWPEHSAKVYIIFDYGIDDIRANLQFIKEFTKNSVYSVKGQKLHASMDKAIYLVEKEKGLRKALKNETIDLWMEIESKFQTKRKPKLR